MRTILLCAARPLEDELQQTLLFRSGVERHQAAGFPEAMMLALATRPDLVVVDRDLPSAERLVRDLRGDPATRGRSIAIAARGDFQASELVLLEAGANAVVRLPATAEAEARLGELMSVPARRAQRVPAWLRLRRFDPTERDRFAGIALDLSVAGMLLETLSRLRVGNELRFGLLLPDAEEPLAGGGQVVREAGAERFGVRFLGLNDTAADRLRLFVTEGLAGGTDH